MKVDIWTKTTAKSLAVIFGLCLIALGQETVGLFVLTNLGQPTINWSNVEETFEENHPPILIFTNSETATGEDTSEFFAKYTEKVNEESESVQMESVEFESGELPDPSEVNELMTEVAHKYFEEMEEFEEEKEAFGAYYIYSMD